jgi:hypothetical protein
MERKDHRPLADRRAADGAPVDGEEHDFAEERTPSPSDPVNAPADAPGGEDEGYTPQTELPSSRPAARRLLAWIRNVFSGRAR